MYFSFYKLYMFWIGEHMLYVSHCTSLVCSMLIIWIERTANQNTDQHSIRESIWPKCSYIHDLQVITPYECEYTVMLSPPSAPVVKESTGITMFIIDEMREAKEAKARLAKVIIDFNFQTDLYTLCAKTWQLCNQDQLIKKMAMEQKMRREAAAMEQRRIRAGQNPHVYNAQLLWHLPTCLNQNIQL